jgi:hypothetical protein
MKNFFIFLLISSSLFSCEKGEGFSSPAGFVALTFMLLPRTTTDTIEITKPVIYENEEIHILQHDGKLLVSFNDPQTHETTVNIHHARLSVDNLRYLATKGNELHFRYPNGTVKINCDAKNASWEFRPE